MKIDDALEIAKEADLDLVEVTPNAKPPVCKVMNYGKFRFEQNKKAQQAKKKQKQQQVKEVKLRPSTEEVVAVDEDPNTELLVDKKARAGLPLAVASDGKHPGIVGRPLLGGI